MVTPVQFSPIHNDVLQLIQDRGPISLDPANAVYTNRDLDLSAIQLVGFDMDYTLAVYKKAPMEELQYKLTVERLISQYHYPESIRSLAYDPLLVTRGLVVDKKRGHLFKMDDHSHVWRAMHGKRLLNEEEIEACYLNTKIKIGTPQFASLDSLFAMPESSLYCNLLDHFEHLYINKKPIGPLEVTPHAQSKVEGPVDTWKLFDDVRSAIDSIHSDGSLKSIITQNLDAYIVRDKNLAITLHKLRSTGKRLFLLTNSYFNYTQDVMSYLLNNQLEEYNNWRSYFDIIIVGGKKPEFFVAQNPFYELDLEADLENPPERLATGDTFERNKVYLGGNIHDFEKRAHCKGEHILYVGDHIYGDIVRSKKESLWRTCLVIEELPQEIHHWLESAQEIRALFDQENQRASLDSLIGNRRVLLAHLEALLNEKNKLSHDQTQLVHQTARTVRLENDQAKRQVKELDAQIAIAQETLERRFHPIWGRLLTEHGELSRFGEQVTSYACIYTSQVANLLQYSPQQSFKAASEAMSHEKVLLHMMPF